MPATITNLTDGTVAVPIVDYTFGPREVRTFEFVEYDNLLNDRVVSHLIDIGVIVLAADGDAQLTPDTHKTIDQIVHDMDENYYLENTYTGAQLTQQVYWEDNTKAVKIREHQYTWALGYLTQEVIIQYDEAGLEAERMTIANTWTGGKLISQTAVSS